MTSNKLPAVLATPHGSISVERVLNQIRAWLDRVEPADEDELDRLDATFDDIATMLKAIER